MQFAWTDGDIDQLKQLRADGLTSSQIGAALGVSRNAVIGKAARLGLPMPIRTQPRYRPSSRAPRRPKPAANEDRRLTIAFRQPPFVPVEPVAIERPPEFLGVALLDLNPDDCRYPHGEGSEIRFCGQPQIARSSYCRYCHAIVYPRRVTT